MLYKEFLKLLYEDDADADEAFGDLEAGVRGQEEEEGGGAGGQVEAVERT